MSHHVSKLPRTLASMALGSVLLTVAAAQSGYRVGERANQPAPAPVVAQSASTNAQESAPVRLARFSYLQGDVTYRTSSSSDWTSATLNLPLREAAEIWVTEGSRAEIQFDDGSYVRLGGGAVCTLHTMYSDQNGEFTELKVTNGLVTVQGKSQYSQYQVDTPLGTVKVAGTSLVRIGAGEDLEVAVREGEATVDSDAGTRKVYEDDFLQLDRGSHNYQRPDMPAKDEWDRFSDDRVDELKHVSANVPSNIGLVAGDLDRYGDWHEEATYGTVWYPRVTEVGWRPYSHGQWVWVEPFGWTWCGQENWGWAPYHYGTWIETRRGWGWCPGPAHQYWSPAVVHFAQNHDGIGWCPLAPGEVRYPSALSVGFRSGNWSLYFSIGGTACYVPHGNICEPRPWRNVVVNRVTNVYNITRIHEDFSRMRVVDNHFVSRNDRDGHGITLSKPENFGHGGRVYTPVHSDSIFRTGRTTESNGRYVSGPALARPEPHDFQTHTRPSRPESIQPPVTYQSRPVIRTPLPAPIEPHSRPMPGATTSHRWNPSPASTSTGSPDRFGRPSRTTNDTPGARPSRGSEGGSNSRGEYRHRDGGSSPRDGGGSGRRRGG